MPTAFDRFIPPNDHDPLANLLQFSGEIDQTVEAAGGLIRNFLQGLLDGVVEIIKELTGLDLSELATALEGLDLSSPEAFITSLINLLITLPDILTSLVNQIINLLIAAPDMLTPLINLLLSLPGILADVIEGIASVTGLDLNALGALNPVAFLTQLQTAFADLDFSSPTAFINSIITAIDDALGIDLAAITAGSIQPLIDAILGPAGFAPGAGDATDVLNYFDDLLAMLANPSFASGSFNPVTAVETFITSMIHPTNLLAPLVGGTVPLPNIPALGIGNTTGLSGYLANLNTSGVLALTGLASGTLPAGVTAGITQITSLPGYLTHLASTGVYDASVGFNNVSTSLLKNITASGVNLGQVAASAVAGALSNATIAGTALSSAIASGNVPSLPAGWGGTIHGSLLTGAVASSLLSGALPAGVTAAIANITGLSGYLTNLNTSGVLAAAGVSGALTNATIDAAKVASGILAAAQIPAITAAMAPALAPIDAIVNALGNPATGNTAAMMAIALQNIPHPNVQGNLGSTGGLGSTIQNMLDQGVQAINNSSAVGNSIGLWYQALDNMGNFLGFNPNGTSPAGSIANTIASRSIQNNLWESIDPTTNGVFSLADIESLTTLPTVAVTSGASVIGYINTRDGGVKQSVRWLGFGVTGITSFILNLYSVNTATGTLTNIFSTPNIIATVGTGTTPTWNAYNLAAASYLNAGPGNLYAVELVVAGSGTYNIVGKTLSTQLLAHPTAIPAMKGAVRAIVPQFDAIGPGNSAATNSTGITFTHTANGPVLVYVYTSNTANTNTASATYGGVAMTRLGTALTIPGGNFYFAHVFKLDTPAAGPQTVAVTCPSGWVKANAVSYTNATFGTPVTTTGSGTALSHTVSSAAGAVVSQAFFPITATSFSAYNQTQRWYSNTGTWAVPILIGDAPGAASVPFTATGAPTGGWASITVPITGPSVTSPATIANPALGTSPANYSNLTPWFGLAGSAGATVFAPVMAAVTANGTINPGTLYPWANHFDIAVAGNGGGGAGGAGIFGGNGGNAGAWTTATLTKAQAGTSNWTITNIATGGGGGSGAGGANAAGTVGGQVTCAIPGYGNISAAGGAGGTGTAPQPLANPGASLANKVYPNFYGVNNTFPGGAGGGSGQAPGGQPGGGGAGGNSANFNGFNVNGGTGGNGIVYVLAYQ